MGSLNPENTVNQDLNDSGCVQDVVPVGENGHRDYPNLLDLSDDVLLCILQHLCPRDLKALGHTCPRLGALVCDRTLWTRVDARDGPTGQKRLRWLLTHCLSPATTELKLTGYANKKSRCLGVQDVNWPGDNDQDFIRGACLAQEGVDVEHFLLRMWYPHLPRRHAVTPRWPDKEEVDRKVAKAEAEKNRAAPKAGSSGQSSSSSGTSDQIPSCSSQNDPDLDKADQNSGSSTQKPPKTAWDLGPDFDPSNPTPFAMCHEGQNDPDKDNSDQKLGHLGPKKENDDESILFEDDHRDGCNGPQFSLSTSLLKDLKKKCMHLTSLALEYCNLDYKTTNLRQFPLRLKKLSLRGTSCYNIPVNTSYLGKVQDRLPCLEYLDISECDWFEPASLMPLSKLPLLTELYMRDCKRLTECVAYASLATRYGFRKLKVFDVRGSPMADSEVSALGWLPCLEELYVSPPVDYSDAPEHTHIWTDTRKVFNELDNWEIEEPEYYKFKTPEQDMDEDEKEEEPNKGTERAGTDSNTIGHPMWTPDRRIIVIQPNSVRNNEERMQRRPEDGEAAQDIPPAEGPRDPVEPPRDNRRQIASYRLYAPICSLPEALDILPAHMNAAGGAMGIDPIALQLRAGYIQARPAQPSDPYIIAPGPPGGCRACPLHLAGPSRPQPGPANPQPGPANPQPGPANPQPGPANPQPGPANPQPGPANAGEGPSKRRCNVGHAIDLAKRRRVGEEEEDEEDQEMQAPPPPACNYPAYDPQCPRLRLEYIEEPEGQGPEAQGPEDQGPEDQGPARHRFVRVRRREPRHVMQIDVDTHAIGIHATTHPGYTLVSDSAVLRFGRAANDNVNYVHIGRNGVQHGSDNANRPDRSSLRILSMTGYRNITDRSLEHLVTSAPHLTHIDFTETSVTPRGVEIFKAVKPDCEVVFSRFSGGT